MFAPPLYIVRSFPLRLLVTNNYELSEEFATDRQYNIKQQDNQMFRLIRLITGDTRKFNRYVVFVDSHGVSKYAEPVRRVITDGIVVGGKRFFFGERSASMTRNGIFSFVSEDIYAELNRRITMDIHMDKTVLSKYYAYRGLFFSSCHCLDGWRPKVIVVPDCIVTVKDQRIRYLYDSKSMLTNANGEQFEWTQKDIAEKTTDIDINAFDGCGIIHPELADEIRELIGSKTPVTSFIMRAPFIKGCVHAVDYPTFFAERGVDYIRDIWGRWHDASEKMLIITESMYKGLKYFKKDGTSRDWDRYWDLFEKYGHCIGVAKWNFSFEEEPIFTRMNYQILQDLDLPYDEFASLADDSKEWAERIMGGDPLYTYVFLGLMADHCNPVNCYAKAVLKNPAMLTERHVRKFLHDSIRKYIDGMKCGKLWSQSCFKFLVPDLIMMLEHIGGLPLNGCLDSNEFYSRDADGPYVGQYLVERNPHICRSEHALMTAKCTSEIEKYVGLLSNIAMVNSKSLIAQRLNGADFDGDLVLVIKNETMARGVHPDLPIVLDVEDKITALVEEDNVEHRIALTMRTMQSLIGKYSNCSSAYHNKTPKSVDQKKLYMKYVDIISILTGKAIDMAKTGVLFKMPRYIEQYAKPLPYFMKYRKPYYAKQKLSMAWSNMNHLCIDLEKWHKKLTWKRQPAFDYTIMIDDTIPEDPRIASAIESLFIEYNNEIKALLADQRRVRTYQDDDIRQQLTRSDAENFVIDWGSCYEKYKRKCADVCSNKKELANIAVRLVYEKYPSSKSKFHWVVAEEGILDNIKQVETISLPMRDKNGELMYLGRKYSMVDVNPNDQIEFEDLDLSEFDDEGWDFDD